MDFARQMADLAEPPGRDATLYLFSANVKPIPIFGCILLELYACSIHLLGQLGIYSFGKFKSFITISVYKTFSSIEKLNVFKSYFNK